MSERNDELMTVDLLEVFHVLVHKLWAIVLAALIFGGATFGVTFFLIEPEYQAKTLMYVNNSDISVGATSFSISNADLTAAQKLVNTYVVILNSRTNLNEVLRQTGLDYTYEELQDMIEAQAVNSTEFFEIVVTSHSPTEAEFIANTIANVLPDKISDIVAGSDVRIVDYAVVPAKRSAPSYTKNTVLGALLGAVLCAAVVVLKHIFDENIRSEDYLTQTYPDIPLLSVIPDMNSTKQRSGYYGYRKSSEESARAASKRSADGDSANRKRAENGK